MRVRGSEHRQDFEAILGNRGGQSRAGTEFSGQSVVRWIKILRPDVEEKWRIEPPEQRRVSTAALRGGGSSTGQRSSLKRAVCFHHPELPEERLGRERG
ncbi:hypothetical protein T01_14990 [Trichinella spiralis]|uniref:Uncharacterized protein n=1 Tax=Trichinella spiralis TaxID=6334 RepID=A0A0V1C1Y3_TRISP|nr:hypothetical protein T01_14990 [Trichinella spiralis]